MTNFNKIYALDTNIILNNTENLFELSDGGNNLIVIPETVLDELDSKKSGLDEISFQARNFARLLQDTKIITRKIIKRNSTNEEIGHIVITEVQGSTIYIIAKSTYEADKDNIDKSIRNDRKILEAIEMLKSLKEFKKVKFISLDIMARIRSLSLGIPAEALTLGKKEVDSERDFHTEVEIASFTGDIKEIPVVEEHISSIKITNKEGKPFIYFHTSSGWQLLPEKNDRRLPAPPINMRQKIMTELALTGTDILTVVGPAGTGKTLVALSSAMNMFKSGKKNIYYIRRTVISGSSEDELGFLPGGLEDKMSGYNQPMEDSIRKIAQLSKRNASKEDIDEKVDSLKEKYNIEYLYAGHLRGSTLEDDSVLIIDEVQNFDITSLRTIISRVGKNTVIFAMGSNNQIDTKFLTKNTNALTFLMDKCSLVNQSGIRVNGVRLTNVMRSKIAEWADLEVWR